MNEHRPEIVVGAWPHDHVTPRKLHVLVLGYYCICHNTSILLSAIYTIDENYLQLCHIFLF